MRLKNFSNYEIDVENGTVWSYKSNRFVGSQNEKGYWCVTLTDDDGEQRFFRRCRLIYETANGEIPEEMQVNHINETVWDDRLENLNLLSPNENVNYGTGNARRAEKLTNRADQSKSVAAYQNGVLAMVFPSTREAQRQGYDSGAVSKCCNGKLPHYKNFTWKYLS